MLCGRLPFYSKSHDTLFDLILNQDVKYPSSLTPTGKSILTGLLNKNPSYRLVNACCGDLFIFVTLGKLSMWVFFFHFSWCLVLFFVLAVFRSPGVLKLQIFEAFIDIWHL